MSNKLKYKIAVTLSIVTFLIVAFYVTKEITMNIQLNDFLESVSVDKLETIEIRQTEYKDQVYESNLKLKNRDEMNKVIDLIKSVNEDNRISHEISRNKSYYIVIKGEKLWATFSIPNGKRINITRYDYDKEEFEVFELRKYYNIKNIEELFKSIEKKVIS